MPSTTPINALRYAVLSDAPDAQTALQNLATDADKRVVSVFSTSASRDGTIGSPDTGMVSYLTTTSAGGRVLTVYDGSAWRSYFRAPLFARKTATESVTSNTTVQADDHLFVTLEANSTYVLDMWLNGTGADAGDLKYNFTYPSGTSVAAGAATYNTASTGAAPVINSLGSASDGTSPTIDFTAGTIAGVSISVIVRGLVVVGATAGNLALQWAQNSSNGTATTLDAGSYLMLTRVA